MKWIYRFVELEYIVSALHKCPCAMTMELTKCENTYSQALVAMLALTQQVTW